MEQRCCSNSSHLKFLSQEIASSDKTMQNLTSNWTERNKCLSPRRCAFFTFQMHWSTTAGKTSLESAHEVQYPKHGASYPRRMLALPPSNFYLFEASFIPADDIPAAWRWHEYPFPIPDIIESVVGHLVMHLVVERRRDVARRLAPKVGD